MADPEVVTHQLKNAGYTEIAFRRIDAQVMVGRDVDDAVAFQLAALTAGEVYRAAGAEAEQKRGVLVAALRDELQKFARLQGAMMESSSWMVTARNP